MGQKVHPYGFRLGTLYGWKSNWYEERRYAEQVLEDHAIRKHIKKKLYHAGHLEGRDRPHGREGAW